MPDLKDARVLSVDVFDTLLARAVPRPVDVFPHVALRAHALGALAPRVTPEQFAAVRQAAEAEARQAAFRTAKTHEVSLPDIYGAMPQDWFPLGVEPMPRVELDTEGDLVYPNVAVLARVREARCNGIPVVLTSDTYLSAQQLRVLLRRAGIEPEWFAHVIVSSQYGVSKHDGRLFQHVRTLFPHASPASIVHVGDNPHADVQQATRAGLTAFHHDNGQASLSPIVQAESWRHGSVLPSLQSLRAIAATVDAPCDADGRWWFGLGAVTLGPALAAFADWVLDECEGSGIRTIRPLMREGALFATLLARAAAARGRAFDIAPLHASRHATWLAGLDRFDAAAAAVLLQRTHLTVREALAIAGLDVAGAGDGLRGHAALDLARAATTVLADGRTVSEALRDELLAPTSAPTIAAHLAAQRAALAAYLEHACASEDTIALVDLGFHGSTGRAIQSATRATSPRRYVQMLAVGAEGLVRAWQRGEDIRVFGAGPGLHADLAGPIVRHPALLEALLIDGGTTTGYVSENGISQPQLDASHAPEPQRIAAAACRDGVLAFQARWIEWSALRPDLARAVLRDRRGLIAPIHRLLTMPTAVEVDRLGDWVHEDNEGGHAVRPLTQADAVPPDVTPAAFLRATASGGRAWGTQWTWPAGTCARRWPGHAEDLWQDAVGSGDGAPPAVHALAARLRREQVRRCDMWGAGEVGLAMLRALRQSGVAVRLVIDSNPALHGTLLDGVPVLSPEHVRGDAGVIVIASLAFADEIARRLQAILADAAPALRIVQPVEEVLA